MKTHLTVRGSLDTAEVRRWLERPLARLRRQLVRFPDDAVHLRVLVREAEGAPRAEASLSLRLPSHTLAAAEEEHDACTALKEAFQELERLLKKEKARLRRADGWRDAADGFRRELLDRVALESERALNEAETRRLRRDLASVERFVLRELRWFEDIGDLAPGEVDPRDVIDTAFSGAISARQRHPSRLALLGSAARALRSELDRARAAREEVHLEEDVPEVPPAESVSTLGSEIIDYHQPDEDLRMEDVLADLSATPEELEATAELSGLLQDALRNLPSRWGQAFRLALLEGLDESEIAHVLGVDKEAVSAFLAHTHAFLRERIAEAEAETRAPEGRTGRPDPGTMLDGAPAGGPDGRNG